MLYYTNVSSHCFNLNTFNDIPFLSSPLLIPFLLRFLILHLLSLNLNINLSSNLFMEFEHFELLFHSFHLATETLLSHKTMLTNEYFKISTRIENEHDIVLESVCLTITVPPHLRNKGKSLSGILTILSKRNPI